MATHTQHGSTLEEARRAQQGARAGPIDQSRGRYVDGAVHAVARAVGAVVGGRTVTSTVVILAVAVVVVVIIIVVVIVVFVGCGFDRLGTGPFAEAHAKVPSR